MPYRVASHDIHHCSLSVHALVGLIACTCLCSAHDTIYRRDGCSWDSAVGDTRYSPDMGLDFLQHPPDWCRMWLSFDANTRVVADASRYDDYPQGPRQAVPNFTIRVFYEPLLPPDETGLQVFIDPNGFVSLIPFAPCSQYCYDYMLNGNRGPLVPMISLFNSDLDPSGSSTTDPVTYYRHESGEVLIVTYTNVPRWGYDDPTEPNLTAQMELWRNGTIIMRYRSFQPLISPWALQGIVLSAIANYSFVRRITLDPLLSGAPFGAAFRYDLPSEDCGLIASCVKCTASSSCVWCGRFGVCMNSVYSSNCPAEYVVRGSEAEQPSCTSPLPYILPYATRAPDAAYYTTQTQSLGNNGSIISNLFLSKITQAVGEGDAVDLSWSIPVFAGGGPADSCGSFHRVRRYEGAVTLKSLSSTCLVTINVPVQLAGCPICEYLMFADLQWDLWVDKHFPREYPRCVGCGRSAAFLWKNSPASRMGFVVVLVLYESGVLDFYHFYDLSASSPKLEISSSALFASNFFFSPTLLLSDESMLLEYRSSTLPIARGNRHTRLTPRAVCLPCLNGGLCNDSTRVCDCPGRLGGKQCRECAAGYYASPLNFDRHLVSHCVPCPSCFNGGRCNSTSGTCVCAPGTYGVQCEWTCSSLSLTVNTSQCAVSCRKPFGICVCGRCFCLEPYQGANCSLLFGLPSLLPLPNPEIPLRCDDVCVLVLSILTMLGCVVLCWLMTARGINTARALLWRFRFCVSKEPFGSSPSLLPPPPSQVCPTTGTSPLPDPWEMELRPIFRSQREEEQHQQSNTGQPLLTPYQRIEDTL